MGLFTIAPLRVIALPTFATIGCNSWKSNNNGKGNKEKKL